MKKLSFAIIGGGPAGFYLAKCLSKLPTQPIINIFQQQLCPFGLIRYGVAPDHISIKKSELSLSSISHYQHFSFIGNQKVDAQFLKVIKQQHSAIVFAHGAQQNTHPDWFQQAFNQPKSIKKTLNNQATIPNLQKNIFDARDIVYWYNNHPSYQKFKLNLTGKTDVLIIGNGNVAIDISRVLLRKPEELKSTEISENALEELEKANLRNITVVGRRGVTHSSFSLKQVRELTEHGIDLYVIKQELEESMNQASYIECTSIGDHLSAIVRMNKRKNQFIKNKFKIISKDQLPSILELNNKKIIFRYLLNPIQIKNNQMEFVVTKLQGAAFKQTAKNTQKSEYISYDILVNSTGFKVDSIDSEKYKVMDNKLCNSNGCYAWNEKVEIGSYAVGWCKSGPRGVIDETLLSCEETFNNIRIHCNQQLLLSTSIPQIPSNNHVNFQQYLSLRKEELSLGDSHHFIKKKLNFKQLKQFFAVT